MESFSLRYYGDLCHMYRSWDQSPPFHDDLPQIGYIVYEDLTPIAAAFLRKVEGGYAQLDGLVSNRSVDASTRNDGLDRVITACMDQAKALKIKAVLATTLDKNTLSRAHRHGFETVPMTVVVADPNRSK